MQKERERERGRKEGRKEEKGRKRRKGKGGGREGRRKRHPHREKEERQIGKPIFKITCFKLSFLEYLIQNRYCINDFPYFLFIEGTSHKYFPKL
jgi:hypothetical protein